jgi:hypothetical protein
MLPAPEERDPSPCLLWVALGLAFWTVILFGVTYYAAYRMVN